MRHRIIKWLLGETFEIQFYSNVKSIQTLESKVELANQSLKEALEHQKELAMYVKSMLDYFDFDFSREYIPDPRYLPAQPATMPIIRLIKRKKAK